MKTTTIAAAAFFVLASAPASAACIGSDTAGTWRVFVNGHGTSQTLSWQRCALKVLASGDLNTSSFCISDGGAKTSVLSGSSFTLATNCRFTGKIRLTGGIVERIVDGQLSRDKLTMVGVAKDPGGPSTFVGIKR